jgi:tetratricopeptide (TPR) repeat protein
MKKGLYIIILLLSPFLFAQLDSAFEKGNSLYNKGQYQDAIKVYESILEQDKHSSELYYNIANAYYKLNSIAPSIYYYEKALMLNPNDKEIRNNLAFAQNMTIDAIEEIPEMGFSKFMKRIINTFNFNFWAVLSIVFVFVSVLFFLGYYFSFSTAKKRLLFLGSFTSFVLMITSLFFAFQGYSLDSKNNPAIIFSQECQVRLEPNLRSENAFTLHEGTKVQILESYNNDWAKIKIANGKTGWVDKESIKRIKDHL